MQGVWIPASEKLLQGTASRHLQFRYSYPRGWSSEGVTPVRAHAIKEIGSEAQARHVARPVRIDHDCPERCPARVGKAEEIPLQIVMEDELSGPAETDEEIHRWFLAPI